MTYDIKIFKSDSYQKILKAVLQFRYPELSYEEALVAVQPKTYFLHEQPQETIDEIAKLLD